MDLFAARMKVSQMKRPEISRAVLQVDLELRQGFMTAGEGVGVEPGATEFPLVVFG